MSTEITNNIDVTLDSVDINNSDTQHTVENSNQCLDLVIPESLVEGYKKEYSIVGDGFYASVSADEAPQWLLSLIDDVVINAVSNNMTNYNQLVQDVRDAIDAIDVAKNTYVEQIDITNIVDGVLSSHLETLNASYDTVSSTLVSLDIAVSTVDSALGQRIDDIDVEFQQDISARVTAVTQAYAAADQALADSIEALTALYTDSITNIEGVANAVESLQTYVGVTSTGEADGSGILGDIQDLQNQLDGILDIHLGQHVVLTENADPDDPVNTSALLEDTWPYSLWAPITGVVNPDTVPVRYRSMTKDGSTTNFNIEVGTVYHNTSLGTYWKFTGDAATNYWESITEAEYNIQKLVLRDLHLNDYYVRYGVTGSGSRVYLGAWQLVKTDTPDIAAPLYSDVDGYYWEELTNALDIEKAKQFLESSQEGDDISRIYSALGTDTNPGTGSYSYYFTTGLALYRTADSSLIRPEHNDQAYVEYINGDEQTIVAYQYYKPTDDSAGQWLIRSDSGELVARARWAIDLDTYLGGRDGSTWGGETSLSNVLQTTTDGSIYSAFQYNSLLHSASNEYYNTGFGLVSNGAGTGTVGDPFDSTFYVQADKFVVLDSGTTPPAEGNPPTTGVLFEVDGDTGQTVIGRQFTNATVFQGNYGSAVTYSKGDLVVNPDGLLYVSKSNNNTGNALSSIAWELVVDRQPLAFTYNFAGPSAPNDAALTTAFLTVSGLSEVKAGDTLTYTVDGLGSFTGRYTGLAWAANVALQVNGDAVIDGTVSLNKLVADASGYVASSNFVTGVSGWAITGDGDAEFNSLNVRASQMIGGLSQGFGHSYRQLAADGNPGEIPLLILPMGNGSTDPAVNHFPTHYGIKHPDTFNITNPFDVDGKVTVTVSCGFINSDGTFNNSGKNNPAQGLLRVNKGAAGTNDLSYKVQVIQYGGSLSLTGSFDIPAGETYEVELWIARGHRNDHPPMSFTGGEAVAILSTDPNYTTFTPLDLDSYNYQDYIDNRVYRYMYSETETGTYTETATASTVWVRIDYTTDDGLTWYLGTPTNTQGVEGLPGADGISLYFSNQAVAVPADVNGNVSSYANTGTEIGLRESGQFLTYDANVATNLTPGTWGITSITAENITVGSVSGTTSRTFANASNMTADTAKIDFTGTYVDSKGNVTSDATITQTFTKARAGAQGIQGIQGDPGADGDPGANGPRSATAYYYYYRYNTTTPTLGLSTANFSYNFTTGEATSSTTYWTTTIAPTDSMASTSDNIYAIRVSFQEATYGGTVNKQIYGPFSVTRFDGLVTFTNSLYAPDSIMYNSTEIDGGNIRTGTITVDSIKSGVQTVTDGSFGIGVGAAFQGHDIQLYAESSTGSQYGVGGINTATSGSDSHGIAGLALSASSFASVNWNTTAKSGGTIRAEGHLAGTGYGGRMIRNFDGTNNYRTYTYVSGYDFGVHSVWRSTATTYPKHVGYLGHSDGSGVIGQTLNTSTGASTGDGRVGHGTYAFYAVVGTLGPFTGSHDGLMVQGTIPELGDILIDVSVYAKKGVDDAICINEISTSANQKGAIGVFSSLGDEDHLPAAIAEEELIVGSPLPNAEDNSQAGGHVTTRRRKKDGYNDFSNYSVVRFNSLGEGLINVCGENGDIEIGDLIVTSSTPGKGMKQSDDLVRNITVAKSREAVTFSSPEEIKQIACIYLCG